MDKFSSEMCANSLISKKKKKSHSQNKGWERSMWATDTLLGHKVSQRHQTGELSKKYFHFMMYCSVFSDTRLKDIQLVLDGELSKKLLFNRSNIISHPKLKDLQSIGASKGVHHIFCLAHTEYWAHKENWCALCRLPKIWKLTCSHIMGWLIHSHAFEND